MLLKYEILLIKEKAKKVSKQELDDYLSIYMLKLFPDDSTLSILLAISDK